MASQRNNVVNVVDGDHGLVAAPTRLINVGSKDPKDPPRLVDGQECLYKGGYLVLSYCWGITPKDAHWQLSTKTLPHFSCEIPLETLPQTLHDAILWTRTLGEHYIWIDSMCIMQDSKDDWDHEASQMASIYGNATMTIVSASSSAYGGLSDRRNPLRNSAACLLPQEDTSGPPLFLLPNGQRRGAPVQPAANTRAWCYQEDVLSSRLLKLSQTFVEWQCVGDKNSNSGNRAQCLEQLGKHPPFRWYTLWYQLLERYTNRNLTFPKDKLLAFHGIACDKADRDYLAGFLKSDPWMSLLWCRDEDQVRRRPGSRYADYRYVAPSWSWASIDAPVLFYEASARHWRKRQLEHTHMDPELLHVEVEKASQFVTGAVKSGIVAISAFSAIARAVSSQPFLFNTGQGAHIYGRQNLVDPLTQKAFGLIVFDVATEAKDDMLLVCVLLETAALGLWEKNGTAGLGLALQVQKKTTSGLLKCTRVGYVQFTPAFGAICHKREVEIS